MLLNKKGVAKVSKTPGKTKLINYFLVNDNLYFVDLPGYGYAKLSKKNKIEISKINQTYFKNRNQLKEIFLLIDIRHKLQIIDLEFMSFLKSIDRDFTIIFTKKDKIKDTVVANYCKDFLKSIENIYDKEEYFVSSSKTRYGREDILEYISKVSH
jgi:GTP-binding protein